jgi:hypothetical protein
MYLSTVTQNNSNNNNANNNTNKNLLILTLNIRSWSRHFDEFAILLWSLEKENTRPDIIVLTKSWLDTDKFTYYQIKGYKGYISERNDGTRSGGVVVFIDDNIPHKASPYHGTTFQAVSLTIETPTRLSPSSEKHIEILGLYRDLRKSSSEFINELENTFLKLNHPKLLVTGDFNIDLLNPTNSSQQLVNTLTSYGLLSYQNQPSRIGTNKNNETTVTCLDQVHVRSIEILSVEVKESGITDHQLILTTAALQSADDNKTDNSCNGANERKQVTYKYLNRNKFQNLLQNETWNEIDFSNVDVAFESFINIYNNHKTSSTESKQIQIKKKERKRSPWLSDKTLELAMLKKQIYSTLKRKKSKDDSYDSLKTQFKSISAEVVKNSRKDKINYYSRRLNNCKNSRQYWREFKDICHRSNETSKNEIKLKKENNSVPITDQPTIAELLNTHFVKIAEKELSKNSLFDSTSEINYSLDKEEKNFTNSFGSHEITMIDLYRAIKKNSPIRTRSERTV